jgi:hypothetical protein
MESSKRAALSLSSIDLHAIRADPARTTAVQRCLDHQTSVGHWLSAAAAFLAAAASSAFFFFSSAFGKVRHHDQE